MKTLIKNLIPINVPPSIMPIMKKLIAYMVNSETPQNVRPTVPVDRSGFKKKFKCLKGRKKNCQRGIESGMRVGPECTRVCLNASVYRERAAVRKN